MSPKKDNQDPSAKADVTVDIPHDERSTPAAPSSAPPLPQLETLPPQTVNINDNSSTPPPTLPPVTHHEYHEHTGRRWPITALYLILALLVAAVVVFAGRWIYRSLTHKSKKSAPPITSSQSSTTKNTAAGSNSTSSNSAGSNPATGTGANQTGKNQAAGQLPNNGPGDVVAIFAGAALAVGGLHFIYNLRKQN